MTINSHAKLPHFMATGAILALVALAPPVAADASPGKPGGVQAELDNGTLKVEGGNRPNAVALRLKNGDANQIQVDAGDNNSADFTFARGDVRAISVAMGNGRDSVRIDDANGTFTDAIPTTIAGGNGNDSLNGGQGAETLKGGNGDDRVDGGRGNDTALLGRGDDSFTWDPGEGSDVIEGQSGLDTMVFNGAPVAEQVTMSANGGRLTFFRVQGNVTMDTNLDSSAAVHVLEPGEVYAHDDFVYWGFTPGALGALARHAGFEGFELIDAPVIDGHRRVIGVLRSGALD